MKIQRIRPVTRSKTFPLVAQTILGLEPVLAEELEQLGAQAVSFRPGGRAVNFKGDQTLIYEANLWLRTALRILKPIYTTQVSNEEELYARAQEVDWSRHMEVWDTLAVHATVHSPHFNHSKYVALKTKDAIVDQFRQQFGRRPSVDTENPTLRIVVYISGDQCTFSLDSSGDSLHRRGYRLSADIAPLNEVLAAGMILLSGWKGTTPFVDPMCGSGTLPIEAALIAGNFAPGLLRESFAFMKWRDFDADLWQRLRRKAESRQHNIQVPILGTDISAAAIWKAQENLQRTPLARRVVIRQEAFEDLIPPQGPGVLVVNPPYGERIQPEDVEALYKMIGDGFKQRFTGYQAWVLSSNLDAMKRIGLRASKKIPMMNGPLDCRFNRYELYAGSEPKPISRLKKGFSGKES